MIDLLLLISVLPLLLLIYDVYKRDSMNKAIMTLLIAIAVIGSGFFLAHTFGIGFAIAIPILLIIYVLYTKSKSPKDR